jgi:hypothetical protein
MQTEHQTRDVVQETTTATARRTTAAAVGRPKLRLVFTMKEAARLSGMSPNTLKWWRRRGWVPREFSAWTVVALSILSASGLGWGKGGTLGGVTVRRAMAAVADLDDTLLLAESVQDPYVAEAAAAIASAALPNQELELTEEMMANLAGVVAAIDRKAGAPRNRNRFLR